MGLFALQRYGTHRVGFLFAPIVSTWLFCIGAIGVYNIFCWNPHVYQALSPYYVVKFLKKTQRGGWMALGGVLLCITGSLCLFACWLNLDFMPTLPWLFNTFIYQFHMVFLIHSFDFTGSESMFAGLGRFSQLSVKVCYFRLGFY